MPRDRPSPRPDPASPEQEATAARVELAPLAALASCALGLLGFAAAVAVVQGTPHGFDEAVLRALRRPGAPGEPIGPDWLALTLRDLTVLGGTPVLTLAALVALGALILARRWPSAALLLVSAPGALALNTVLKRGFDRPRPELVAHLAEVRTESFPSAHAMLSAVVFLTLGAILAEGCRTAAARAYVMAVALLLTLLVGLSRVWLGVHWPTDVLAGWCLGAAWAAGCWLALHWLRRRRVGP